MKPKKDDEAIALFVSDLHLSLTPPVFRSNEPDWFKAMQRPIDELCSLQEQHNGCPIFCAGDIFDRWNSAPELINWAIEHLPYMHCIPGQHDLPEHNLGQIERSAYWTLVKASVINNIRETIYYNGKKGIVEFCVTPFAYGSSIRPYSDLAWPGIPKIAIIHEYNWTGFHVYDNFGTTPELKAQYVDKNRMEFKGYDLIVSGDNHSPFVKAIGKNLFWNCGTFLQRKSDETEYSPRIGMLMSDGRMVPHYLDTSLDKYLETADETELTEEMDLSGLIESLGKLGKCALDFSEAVKQQLAQKPVNKRVKTLIQRAMES